MYKEIWHKWVPELNLADKYCIISINDEPDEFSLLLSEFGNRDKKIKVVFDISIDVYRSTDETYRMQLFDWLRERYGEDFCTCWTFFKVSNSEYLDWLVKQSYGILELESFTHFVFIGVNSVVDVVTTYEPKIEFVG